MKATYSLSQAVGNLNKGFGFLARFIAPLALLTSLPLLGLRQWLGFYDLISTAVAASSFAVLVAILTYLFREVQRDIKRREMERMQGEADQLELRNYSAIESLGLAKSIALLVIAVLYFLFFFVLVVCVLATAAAAVTYSLASVHEIYNPFNGIFSFVEIFLFFADHAAKGMLVDFLEVFGVNLQTAVQIGDGYFAFSLCVVAFRLVISLVCAGILIGFFQLLSSFVKEYRAWKRGRTKVVGRIMSGVREV